VELSRGCRRWQDVPGAKKICANDELKIFRNPERCRVYLFDFLSGRICEDWRNITGAGLKRKGLTISR